MPKLCAIRRSLLERLHSAVELVLPCCKGKLMHTKQWLKVWRRFQPPRDTPPITADMVWVVAWELAVRGWPRVASLLLLRWSFGLGPGEALQLRREDSLPAFVVTGQRAMLVLCVKANTKVGRRQVAWPLGPLDQLGTWWQILQIHAFRNFSDVYHHGGGLQPHYSRGMRRGGAQGSMPFGARPLLWVGVRVLCSGSSIH